MSSTDPNDIESGLQAPPTPPPADTSDQPQTGDNAADPSAGADPSVTAPESTDAVPINSPAPQQAISSATPTPTSSNQAVSIQAAKAPTVASVHLTPVDPTLTQPTLATGVQQPTSAPPALTPISTMKQG